MAGATVCLKCFISGRVQGVFFRASTAQQARKLGLDGHAINLDDGRVEVLIAGSAASVEAMQAWLQHGPPQATVTGLDCAEAQPPRRAGFYTG